MRNAEARNLKFGIVVTLKDKYAHSEHFFLNFWNLKMCEAKEHSKIDLCDIVAIEGWSLI